MVGARQHRDDLLTPVAEGTEVVLSQVRFTSPEARDGHAEGWTGILAKLDAAVA